MADYQRPSNKLLLRGTNVTMPSDRLGMEWAQLCQNLRCYRIGEWRQRPGLSLIGEPCEEPILFGIRLTNPTDLTWHRFILTANAMFVDDAGHTVFSSAFSGFSSTGASGVIARPEKSPLPFLFVGDTDANQKFDVDGVASEWGIVAPTLPPNAEITTPAYNIIDECDIAADFTATGGVASDQTRIPATNIAYILFDIGTANWASVSPDTMDENWQPGARVTTSANVETATIHTVQQPIKDTTIGAIDYDNGTGPAECTIALTVPTPGLERNSMVLLDNGSDPPEAVRVISVTLGLDGIPSFRCSTVFTYTAGDDVTGLPSIRIFFQNNHTDAETLEADYVQIAVAGAGLASLSKTFSQDISATDVNIARPLQDDDYIHLSVKCADWSQVDEIQIQFDVDSTTNTFTNNYYFKSIRPPDIQAAIDQSFPSLTAQQQQLQRKQLDITKLGLSLNSGAQPSGFQVMTSQGPLSKEATSGQSQWTELKIPISEFQRVGSDTTRDWKDVAAHRITIQALGAVDIGLDSLWAGGTFGPNTNSLIAPLQGYEYCYVMRNSSTGSRSNPSPPTRFKVFPEREAVAIAADVALYPDPQADMVDFYRRGGSLGTWNYVASAPTSPGLYTDGLPDDIVQRQPLLEINRFKPWPQVDLPKAGLGTAIGTVFLRTSGDSFDNQWTRGNIIRINSQSYTFYSNPSSSTRLELNESVPTGTALVWEIDSPLRDGQPQASVFGPYSGPSADFTFSCGDSLNPGFVKYTNPGDPESASDQNMIELCSPSEFLQNGCVLDGIVFAFSNKRSWRILPSFEGGQTGAGGLFYPAETGLGKGMAGRWGISVGDRIYFIAYDGVYATSGDALENLTDEALAPLFRRDGNYTVTDGSPVTSVGVFPISFELEDEPYLSLTYSKDGLYMTAKDTNGDFIAWFYNFLTKGWSYDLWTPRPSRMIREEGHDVDSLLDGGSDGTLWLVDNTVQLDGVTPISCSFWPREEDFGDSRSNKQLGDVMFDIQPGLNQVDVTAHYNNDTTQASLGTLAMGARSRQLIDLNSGDQENIRSVACELSWDSVANGITYIYEWQPAALPKPEYYMRRATDWDSAGYEGPKWLQGMRLRADTQNLAKSIRVQGDSEITITDLNVTHDGEVTKEYSWPPIITHLIRIIGLDDDLVRVMGVEWIYEPEPPTADIWHMQYSSFDQRAYMHVRDILVPYRSVVDATLQRFIDDTLIDSYTLVSTGGARGKAYFPQVAQKGKLVKYVVTTTSPGFGLAIYLKDIEIRVKAWGSTEAYTTQRPFGDVTRTNGGARV